MVPSGPWFYVASASSETLFWTGARDRKLNSEKLMFFFYFVGVRVFTFQSSLVMKKLKPKHGLRPFT